MTKTIFETLKAKVAANKNHPEKRVGMIGGQLCFFEADVNSSEFVVGDDIEVMITRALYKLHPEGHPNAGKPNHAFLKAIMVRPVDTAIHTLVHSTGFLKNKDTGVISATGVPKGKRKSIELLPGRVGPKLYTSEEAPQQFSYVWIEKASLDGTETVKVLGLTNFKDGRWYNLIRGNR